MHTVVAGETSPLFAVADSEGGVRIYSIETEDSTLLSDAYNTGPVCAMDFFFLFRYLAVYPYTGRVDIYDLQSGEMVFSEENPFVTGYVDVIDTQEDGNGHILVIGKLREFTYGDGILIDQEEWSITARIQNVFAYVKNNN